MAATWVRANCPRVDVQEGFLQKLDEALQRNVGCEFIIGRLLTKSGKPCLVHCYCGEIFSFQLTSQQAARLKVEDAMLVAASGRTQHYHEPRSEPPVRLEAIEVDNANALDSASLIVGTLKFNCDQWWVMPVALQATCEPAGCTSMVLHYHFDGLTRGEGTIRFWMPAISELRDSDGQRFRGVLPLFFQLCIYREPAKASRSHSGIVQPMAGQQSPQPANARTLGVPLSLPSPMPTLVTPETMALQHQAEGWRPGSVGSDDEPAFRAISDIRAVLVDVD